MVHDRAGWWIKIRFTALALALWPAAWLESSAAQAQSIMRSPNLNIQSRIPSIEPNIAGRSPIIEPNIGGRSVIGLGSISPNLRTYPGCEGGCLDRSAKSPGGGGTGRASARNPDNGPRGNARLAASDPRAVAGELVAEIDGSLSSAQADELARRHGLARLQSQYFPLVSATIGLFRITDRRSFGAVSREFSADASVHSVQSNFRYLLQDQAAALTEGDPAQYANAKLRLPQAHTLADGANVTIAVIDSGIDRKHPEFANSIAESYDALGSKEGPHAHGTGIAGAIMAHARLMGSAPAARILAIQAFGDAPAGAESTSFVVLKALDYAVAHGAQIINMSFAGPKDALIERGLAAAAAKGTVLIAAAGNAGPKSPPLFPAADAAVIAVSATDARDRLFAASNRGGYIAVAAPGVDILLPVPDEKYQLMSGTSFSAAYVSGLAALILQRNPTLQPDQVRAILTKTARDLGAPGRDDLFGAGEADAYAAVLAAAPVPVASASDAGTIAKSADPAQVPASNLLIPPAAAIASGSSGADQSHRSPAQ
jgi:subtilisin family serine protease